MEEPSTSREHGVEGLEHEPGKKKVPGSHVGGEPSKSNSQAPRWKSTETDASSTQQETTQVTKSTFNAWSKTLLEPTR